MRKIILVMMIFFTAGICAAGDLKMVENPSLSDIQGEWTGNFKSESFRLADRPEVSAIIRDDVLIRGKYNMKLTINGSFIIVNRLDPKAGTQSAITVRKRPYASYARWDHQNSITETYHLYRRPDGTAVLIGEAIPVSGTPQQWLHFCERRGRIQSIGTYTLYRNSLQSHVRSDIHKQVRAK